MQNKSVHRAMYLEDALNALEAMEATASELESSDAFEAFTAGEKAHYPKVLGTL